MEFIEDTLKDAPGRTHVLLEGNHPDDPKLVAIGYCHNSKVTSYFLITKNADSIR